MKNHFAGTVQRRLHESPKAAVQAQSSRFVPIAMLLASASWLLPAYSAEAAVAPRDTVALSGATRLAHTPTLLRNQTPAICEPLNAALRQSFFGSARDEIQPGESASGEEEKLPGFEFPAWQELATNRFGQTTISQIVGDFDDSGHTGAILSLYRFNGDQFPSNDQYLFFADKLQLDDWIARAGGLPFKPGDRDSPNDIALLDLLRQHAKAPPSGAVFIFRGKYYVFQDVLNCRFVYGGDLCGVREGWSVKRLTDAEDAKPICQAALVPHSDADAILNMPNLHRFMTLAKDIGSTCTHWHCPSENVNDVALLLSVRPWAKTNFENTQNDPGQFEKEDQWISDTWGSLNAWNYSAIERLPGLRQSAAAEAAKYYRDRFGMNGQNANAAGERLVRELWHQSFLFDVNSFRYGQPETAAKLLHGTISSEGLSQLEDTPFGGSGETPLFYALPHHALTEDLLRRGHNPNFANPFGKTPLMYAAQLDYFESASALLHHGAKPEAATRGDLRMDARTALMYAAENADMKLIELLLNAGADPKVVDSEGNTLGLYLASNSKIDMPTRLRLFRTWRVTRRIEVEPGFDCDRASDSVEMAICSSPELSQLEREMSTAYDSVRARPGTFVAEQRRFLMQRGADCASVPSYAAELMRCVDAETRSRMQRLHKPFGLSGSDNRATSREPE